MSRYDLAAAAARLTAAQTSGIPCAPIRDLLEGAGVAEAYAVQEINTRAALAAGRRLSGRKIGLTAKAVQRQLGVDQPDYGMLYADMAIGDREEIAWASLMQPKVEAEIAFVLDRDLTSEQPTAAEVMRAVGYVVPAIEIVGSRIANWDIRIVDTVADNASSGLYVLGGPARRLDGLDLAMCGMVMERRGDPVSSGAGLACLGHPLNAVAWLARTMVACGRPLVAGDVVLSGALGPMVAVAPGDVFEARISGLGTVTAMFAGA